MGGGGQVQTTGAQQMQADIGAQQVADWQQRWAPLLKTFTESTLKAAAPGSAERNRATALAGTDTSAKFGQAQDAALQVASRTGAAGSAKQKLTVTGLGDDQATSHAFGATDADQRVDDATIQGLSRVASVGQGEKAGALASINRSAGMSGAQAENDADVALQNRIGNVSLASQIIGTGAGLWMGRPKTPLQGIQGNDIALGY